jgi:hypothetical protein
MWHLLSYCRNSIRADSLRPKELNLLRPYRVACAWLPVTVQIPKLCTFCGKRLTATVTCLSVSSWWVSDHLYNLTPVARGQQDLATPGVLNPHRCPPIHPVAALHDSAGIPVNLLKVR